MNPLNVKVQDDFITFPLEPELAGRTFQVSKIEKYSSPEEGKIKDVVRYTIFDCINKEKEVIVEAVMESKNDFNIRYYEKVDAVDFNWDFVTLLGTSPFGYNNPKYPKIGHLIYDKVTQDGENFEEVALYMSNEEYKAMSDADKKNVKRDNNGYFFLVDRSLGVRRTLSGKDYFAWLYDRTPNGENYPIYLLIEVVVFETGEEYERKQPKILVYEGKKLLLNDVKVN